MPPIPSAVVTENGTTVYTRADIEKGRQVWQSIGGQQLGSIWGHGGYVAPDWSADWLHREAVAWLDIDTQRETSQRYSQLPEDTQAAFAARLKPRQTLDDLAHAVGLRRFVCITPAGTPEKAALAATAENLRRATYTALATLP